jgi:hypothetical protein
MASSDARDTNTIEAHSSPQDNVDFGQDMINSLHAISQPVEMIDLSQSRGQQETKLQKNEGENQGSQSDETPNTKPQPDANDITTVEDSAIGPATEKTSNVRSTASGPQLVITLLLHSTDTRHPYVINEKYLRKRNINVENNDPVNLTVYSLKELIWRDWREGMIALCREERTNIDRMGNSSCKSYFYKTYSYGSYA